MERTTATLGGYYKWTWSKEFGDYFRYKPRADPGASDHDLEWGRESLVSRLESGQFRQIPPAVPNPASGPSPYVQQPPQIPTAGYFYKPPPYSHPQSQVPHAPAQQVGWNLETSSDAGGSTVGAHTGTPATSVDLHIPSHAEPPIAGVRSPGNEERTSLHDQDTDGSSSQTYIAAPDARYVTIRNPARYFKRGRVFMVVWLEPRGEPMLPVTSDGPPVSARPLSPSPSIAATGCGSTQSIHAKPRIFVVVRQKSKHCLCLPIYTYSSQGTAKIGVTPEDHAPVVQDGYDVELCPGEQKEKLRKKLSIIIEDTSMKWSPFSRVNLTKIKTVECNLKVRTIGRITADCLQDLELLFREGVGLNDVEDAL